MRYLANAFSLNMLRLDRPVKATLNIKPMPLSEFCEEIIGSKSVIGHESTAKMLEELCGHVVPVNRENIVLDDNDVIYIVQVTQMLPEKTILNINEIKQMYEKGDLRFYEVVVSYAPP